MSHEFGAYFLVALALAAVVCACIALARWAREDHHD
jgi:hypothetical protein